MMDWTDRHCRSFHRILSRRARLYTEMVTTGALIHGPRDRLLRFAADEHPVALQLGGSDPVDLATCARMAEDRGYDEVNLNCGCPSDRVQNGRFGACLMAEPELVARCLAAMRAAVRMPVTVKCRIGIDEQDPETSLRRFIDAVAPSGPDAIIVHARKAWLKGLSPRENRDVPPLDYDLVRRVKAERPHLAIVLNGGVNSLDTTQDHLRWADGVMMGRAAYERPWTLAGVDSAIFGEVSPVVSPEQALLAFLPYVERELAAGTHLAAMTRHVLGLFSGRPGARLFRRHIAENAHKPGAGIEVLKQALALIAPAAAVEAA
jgi:tRNA-dihydrouridine synthase A